MAANFLQCWKMFLFVSFVIVPVLGSSCSCDPENLSHPGCGVIPTTSTISNGKPGTYPWMVFLYLLSNKNNSFCVGSIISDIQVLTAAHCIVGKTPEDIGVIIGNQNAGEELTKFNFHIVDKIDINPFFNQNFGTMEAIKKNSDVAVLTLETAVHLTTNVVPIYLPSLSDTSKTYDGVTATVAGWGLKEDGQESVEQLMSVDVPIISNTECKKSYKWLKRYISARNCNPNWYKNILFSLQFSPLHSQRRVKQRPLQGSFSLRWSSVY